MKKALLALLLATTGNLASAQVYNNEWIDYSKTYYKFKVGSTGLYHITQPALSAIGLGGTQAQNFQLWRNGQEVAIYTSIPIGLFSASDFIEFYGEINDGKPDKPLYKYDTLQMSDKWSILTDTASYFLTVNSGSNKRFTNTPNNVATNVLPAETYFTYKLGKYFKTTQNPGFGIDYGEVVHSSSFEMGEGWTSNDIYQGQTLNDNNNNLYVYSLGPPASIVATAAGNYASTRNISLKINNAAIQTKYANGYDAVKFNTTGIALSTFAGDAANVQFSHDGSASDHVVAAYYELSYPRQYNFGGQSQFYFELPSGASSYIVINNFYFGANTPVLFDIANNLRMAGDVNGSTVRFVLPVSVITRKLVLLNTEPAYTSLVNNFTQRNFVNYSQVTNQGTYLLISHSLLFNDGTGIDNVEKYRQYRASAPGGSYNAKTIDIEQLTDQFAFGIKHHPSAIRNFASFALANFTAAPQYFFLIGKGLDYTQFRYYESDVNVSKMALVPTFGWPTSDNLLTASRTGGTARIPIGRLSAISGTEVGDFLDKVKAFELAQVASSQTIGGKAWMKNVAQITGAIDDPALYGLITSYMQGYEQVMADTFFGGKVYSFNKNSGQYTAVGSSKTIDSLFKDGLSMITYFGHSSPNTLEFNLDNPQGYNNTGKYPLIIVNGCNTGNLFLFDTLRPVNKGTLSEKYVFAPQKGGIGFIANTHFGLPQELNYFTFTFDSYLSNGMYGESIGKIMKSTMEYLIANYSYDFIARCHAEEITFHGDPATRLNPQTLPDYTTQDSLITFNPGVVSMADEKITFTTKILNIGKAKTDSLTIRFQHQLPDNSIVTLSTRRIKATLYEDTLQVVLNLNPLKHKGLNRFIVTIDPANLLPELSEINNSITKDFTVIEDEIRPVYPYNYAIVNNSANLALYGSTANPTAAVNQYVMEMDTSRLFNSPFKITKMVSSSGGIIKFLPGTTLTDSTVYYWRLAVGPVNGSTRWLGNSFIYINGSYEGFNQSHYYQYKDDKFSTMNVDSTSRKFYFEDKTRKLLIRTGLYPYYNWDQININIDNDQVDQYGCRYHCLQIAVYDPLTLQPWNNYNVTPTNGRFGSFQVCAAQGPTRNFFEFPYDDSVYRRRAIQFFDSIPTGYYVSISNIGYIANTTFVNQWKADTVNLGSGKSLWHKMHSMGLHKIDSFTNNLPFLFVFRRGDSISYAPRQHIGPNANTHIVDTFMISGKNVSGSIETPFMGPAKSWKNFKWNDKPDSNPGSQKYFDIISLDSYGNEVLLGNVFTQKDTSLAFINASYFPYLKLRMNTSDPGVAKPVQLKYWMLTADEYPEGAVSPNINFQYKDTLNINDTLHLRLAFKNVSKIAFDSIKVRVTITDNAGVPHVYNNQTNGARLKPLIAGDSVIIVYDIPALIYAGQNQLLLDVNPDNDQPEQFHFNNLLYRYLYVVNPVCPSGNTTFNCGNSTAGNVYQWQLNSGAGYVNISNGGVYSGVATGILSISNAPTSMYGYRYRCVITNNGVIIYSNEFILKFGLTWTGASNTNWETNGNWNCNTTPDANTDVIINASGITNFPRVTTTSALCRSVTTKPGATVTINSSKKLDIKGPPGN